MPIAEGSAVPNADGFVLNEGRPTKVNLGELVQGKKAVIFGIPGAFTGTCTKQHLPSFVAEKDALKAKGVDAVICLATNDVFVLDEWNTQHGDPEITMLSDGNGEITRALDLGMDGSAIGFGFRTTRFAMLVEDGTVQALNVEESPGACTVSSASGILERV